MELRRGYVYGITNIVTGQWYVGKTINKRGLLSRWQNHRYNLRQGSHGNKYLQNSWNKYGEKSFMFIELFVIEMPLNKLKDFIYEKEEELTLEKKANITEGGFTLVIGRGKDKKYPEYVRRKISKSLKGITRPHARGWKQSEEVKRRLSTFHTGKKLSEETKKKIGLASAGRVVLKNRGKNHKRSLPVVQLDKNYVFIKRYDSGMDAHRETKINVAHINSVCHKNRKTAGGYVWMFESDYNKIQKGVDYHRKGKKNII